MPPKLNWQLFIVLLTLVITGWGLINLVSTFQTSNRVAMVGDSLKLKAPPEKIVQYTEFDQHGLPLPTPSPNKGNNIVQYIYATNKEVPPTTYQGLTEDISKRTANAQIFLKEVKPLNDQEVLETYVGKFYSGINFNQEGNKWYQTESATTTKTAFLLQTKPTLLTHFKQLLGQRALADTYYAGAGDGYVYYVDTSNWATVHDAVTGTNVSYVSTNFTVTSQNVLGIQITRGFFPFDTSTIPSGATINSATFSVYVEGKNAEEGDGLDYFNVVQTTQPSSSSLTTADYDLCGDAISNPTTGATSINTSVITELAYNTFTLNSTGLSWIAKSGIASSCGGGTGVTCLGIREGHDITNTSAPTLNVGINVSTSERTGTSQDPYLTVTYSVTAPALKINGGTVNINGGTVNVR